VILSARDPWRASLVAAISLALRIAILGRAPFEAVSRVRGFFGIGLRWFTARRQAATTFYALLVLFGIWLTLGPPFGLWPWVYWLPGFNFIRAASRFMLLAMLGLSVLAGAGFDWVTRSLAASSRLAAAAVVAVLLSAEFAVPLEVVPYRIVIPAADQWLARQRTPFTVAEVPLPDLTQVGAFEGRQAQYMLHSTAHWQKTVHGWSGLLPPGHFELFTRMTRFPDEESLRLLQEFGVDYVVVHTDLYLPDERAEIGRRLDAYAGRLELRYSDDTGRVYALTPHSANAALAGPPVRRRDE
jgi:hypothetical protein